MDIVLTSGRPEASVELQLERAIGGGAIVCPGLTIRADTVVGAVHMRRLEVILSQTHRRNSLRVTRALI